MARGLARRAGLGDEMCGPGADRRHAAPRARRGGARRARPRSGPPPRVDAGAEGRREREQLLLGVPQPDERAVVVDADQDRPAVCVGKRDHLAGDALGTRNAVLELQPVALAEQDEALQVVVGHRVEPGDSRWAGRQWTDPW